MGEHLVGDVMGHLVGGWVGHMVGYLVEDLVGHLGGHVLAMCGLDGGFVRGLVALDGVG